MNRLSVLKATEGFSRADVKSVVEDAKALYAWDRQRRLRPRDGTAYLVEAARSVASNRRRALGRK